MTYRNNWYSCRTKHEKTLGHYERRVKDDGAWEAVPRGDVFRALGFTTGRELQRHSGPARSEWGVAYRYVHHVTDEARKAG